MRWFRIRVISPNMVRWAEGLSRETIVRVEGVVQEPPKEMGQDEVKSTSVHTREIRIEKVRRPRQALTHPR